MKDSTNRLVTRGALIGFVILAWIGYVGLVVRQHKLLESADPMNDTGLSFGYHALICFGAPALGITTIAVALMVAQLSRMNKV